MNTIEKLEAIAIHTLDFTHAFAVPGSSSIIDVIHPNTQRSVCYDQTLEQMRGRYPEAQIVALDDWQAERAAAQDSPLTWIETTAEQYDEMLNVLPPAFWRGGLFLVGEPWDHHALTGAPRFAAYRQTGAGYFTSSRPMTRHEAETAAQS